MTARVGVNQPPDHLLIWRTVFLRRLLEEGDAGLAERDGDLYDLFFEDQVFGRGKKVPDPPEPAKRFVSVFDFLFHREPFLFSNIPPR